MGMGNKIAQARKAKQLTQEQLAELMSVTRQSVSRWESEQTYPDMEKISALAEILGVSCDYLLKDNLDQPLAVSGQSTGVTRLLRQVKNKKVVLNFYEDVNETDLFHTPCVITDFDAQWIHVSYTKKKKPANKLLPLSSILSITCVKEEN